MARSPLLTLIPRFPVDHSKFEWETQNEPVRLYTEANSSNTIIDGSGAASNNTVEFSSSTGLEEGMLIRNATRATPVGTYGVDEIMLVTSVSSAVCTVKRDWQYQNTGTGSTAHTLTDVYEVIGNVKQEGSSPDANKYKDVTLVDNYTEIKDFYISVTGSQMASKRLVAGDTIEAQTKMGVTKLSNELESMFLYGALNTAYAGATTYNAGSNSYVRTTKGLQSYIAAAGANVDYSTKAVTADAINAQFAAIVDDKTDPMDKFIIVCNPAQARVISHFGEDIVRTTQESTVWGRSIQTFKTDLGIEADIIWSLNCSKSDLFIIDLDKVGIAEFRPWAQTEWSYGDDGVDAWRQRVLGEYGVKVVDGLYSHAALMYLTWV